MSEYTMEDVRADGDGALLKECGPDGFPTVTGADINLVDLVKWVHVYWRGLLPSPWVPVEERLPPVDPLCRIPEGGRYRFSEEVLIFADGNRHVASLWYLDGKPLNWELELPYGAKDVDEEDLGGIITSLPFQDATHWATLPEPLGQEGE